MSIDTINNYGASGVSSTSNTAGSTAGKNTLTMDDFFNLMVAQLANQDMYNTVDDTQFIAQMAQFSMVQALSDLSYLSATSYSVGLIGKEVTLARINGNYLETYKGIVEGVNLYNGSAQIVVDGEVYALSSVMQVAEPKIIIPADPPEEPADPPEDPGDNNEDDTDGVNDPTEGGDPTDGTGETNNDGSANGGETEGAGESGGTEDGGESGGRSGEGDV